MKLTFWIEPCNLEKLHKAIYDNNYIGPSLHLCKNNNSPTNQQIQLDYKTYINLLENKNIISIFE